MDIQRFTGSSPPSRPMRMAKYPPEIHVRMLGKPEQCLKVWLHWRGKHSYPCLGDNCVDCRDDKFPYGYAPVQLGAWTGVEFLPRSLAILPVTTYGLGLCLRDFQGQAFRIGRHPNNSRGQTTFHRLDCQASSQVQAFDVLPHLENLWAWFLRKDGQRDAEQRVAQMTDLEAHAVCGKIGQAS